MHMYFYDDTDRNVLHFSFCLYMFPIRWYIIWGQGLCFIQYISLIHNAWEAVDDLQLLLNE